MDKAGRNHFHNRRSSSGQRWEPLKPCAGVRTRAWPACPHPIRQVHPSQRYSLRTWRRLPKAEPVQEPEPRGKGYLPGRSC